MNKKYKLRSSFKIYKIDENTEYNEEDNYESRINDFNNFINDLNIICKSFLCFPNS